VGHRTRHNRVFVRVYGTDIRCQHCGRSWPSVHYIRCVMNASNQCGGLAMLFVLADEHGTYYYDPTDEGSIGHTGRTTADFAISDAMGVSVDSFGGRPPGALVIGFTSMA